MDESQEIIQANQSQQPGKVAPRIPEPLQPDCPITFENDFGESPVGLGYFTKDQGAIAILTLAGAFVGAALGGLPFAGVILLAGLNDVRFAGSSEGSSPKRIEEVPVLTLPQAIETSVTTSSAPVEQREMVKTEEVGLQPEQWTPDLMQYPSVLIYGPQGAGKTSTAAWLIRERIKLGHSIKILDPHRAYGQWAGLACIGDGMDYDAINEELKAFTEEIKSRYKARSRTPDYNPPKMTLVCDEFTQWAKKCSNASVFFEESLTDIRKVNLHVLFVSHARTLTGLGGSAGLAATRDAGLLELELEAKVDPTTKKAISKLLGWLKYPGAPQDQRARVAIASWMNGSMDFTDVQVEPIDCSADKIERSEKPLNVAQDYKTERLNALLNKPFNDSGSSEPEPHLLDPFSPGITPQERGWVVTFRRSGRSKEQTIFLVWGAKKGGSKSYLAAKEKLDRILSDSGLE